MKKAIAVIGAFGLPMFAFAVSTISEILLVVKNIIDIATFIVVALALLYFLWGMAKYILTAGDDKDKGRDMMVYGIIALFVMVSVWGLVRVLARTFGTESGGAPPIPTVQGLPGAPTVGGVGWGPFQ